MRDNGRPPTLAVDLREVMIRFGAFIAAKSMNFQVRDASSLRSWAQPVAASPPS